MIDSSWNVRAPSAISSPARMLAVQVDLVLQGRLLAGGDECRAEIPGEDDPHHLGSESRQRPLGDGREIGLSMRQHGDGADQQRVAGKLQATGVGERLVETVGFLERLVLDPCPVRGAQGGLVNLAEECGGGLGRSTPLEQRSKIVQTGDSSPDRK